MRGGVRERERGREGMGERRLKVKIVRLSPCFHTKKYKERTKVRRGEAYKMEEE